jgi:gluconokinase
MSSWYYLPGMVVIVMGVTGAGKSTVGSALASELGWRFLDADDLHPESNVAKMRAGTPLEDADRAPWLASVREEISRSLVRAEPLVVACSALKAAHRKVLAREHEDVLFVLLRVDEPLARQRVAHRAGHFMPPELVSSQLETLEEPERALVIEAAAPLAEKLATVRRALRH